MRLRRQDTGWLGIERSFRFEYSEDGQDRQEVAGARVASLRTKGPSSRALLAARAENTAALVASIVRADDSGTTLRALDCGSMFRTVVVGAGAAGAGRTGGAVFCGGRGA